MRRTYYKVCPNCGAGLAAEWQTIETYFVDPQTGRFEKKSYGSVDEGPIVYCRDECGTLPDLTVYRGRIVRLEP